MAFNTKTKIEVKELPMGISTQKFAGASYYIVKNEKEEDEIKGLFLRFGDFQSILLIFFGEDINSVDEKGRLKNNQLIALLKQLNAESPDVEEINKAIGTEVTLNRVPQKSNEVYTNTYFGGFKTETEEAEEKEELVKADIPF